MAERPINSMSIEISYGDDGQHPRHERLEWITEVHPVAVQIEKRLGHPKTEMGEVVLTASRYPAVQYAGPIPLHGVTEPTKLAHEAITTEPFSFLVRDGEELGSEEAVFQALGAASMCWSEAPHGVFDSRKAEEIGQALLQVMTGMSSARRVVSTSPLGPATGGAPGDVFECNRPAHQDGHHGPECYGHG